MSVKNCIICNSPVNWEGVLEEFEDTFQQANHYGMESLTEGSQHVVEGSICSSDCYMELDC